MNNLRGIFFIIAAMAAFSLEDTMIKTLTGSLPRGQILFLLGLGGSTIFGAICLYQRVNPFSRRHLKPPLIWRTLCEAGGAAAFVTSLALVPLSTVAAVFQATPLAVTLGAALFMGEDVGWRRWSAILTGFIGVLIIIRPGLDGFQPAALIVLVSVLFIAARDLLTRVLDPATPSTIVSFWGFAQCLITGPLMLVLTDAPAAMNNTQALLILGGILCGVTGYYFIVAAMRLGEASAIMPFRYTRLLFSLILGMLIFSESPDALTYLGAALIIASGLYTFLRERQLLSEAAL